MDIRTLINAYDVMRCLENILQNFITFPASLPVSVISLITLASDIRTQTRAM